MSLINLQTGATAAEEKISVDTDRIISELQTRIYKQDLLIRKLNAEADRMSEQYGNSRNLTEEIESLKQKLNESENGRKDSEETAIRAESEKQALQNEIERLNKRPPRIEYKDRCYRCDQDKYKYALAQLEKEQFILKGIQSKAEADRNYFNRLVNRYDSVINERVAKIVKRKTIPQRISAFAEHITAHTNTIFFFAPLLYALFVTVLALLRNTVVRNDFILAVKTAGGYFIKVFNKIKWLLSEAAGLAAYIDNVTAQKIFRWVIPILLIFAILTAIFFIGKFAFKFIRAVIKNFKEEIFTKTVLAFLLLDLGTVVFMGDMVKTVIHLNLFLMFIIALISFILLKITVSIIIYLLVKHFEKGDQR